MELRTFWSLVCGLRVWALGADNAEVQSSGSLASRLSLCYCFQKSEVDLASHEGIL